MTLVRGVLGEIVRARMWILWDIWVPCAVSALCVCVCVCVYGEPM